VNPPLQPAHHTHWTRPQHPHALGAVKALEAVASSPSGLTRAEAGARIDDDRNAHRARHIPRGGGELGQSQQRLAGDIVRPHLLTTAIGQASIAADTINEYLNNVEYSKRPKVDVHHFDLNKKLDEVGLTPEPFVHDERGDLRGTSDGNWAVHNYDDRSFAEVISHEDLYLGHFAYEARVLRNEEVPSSDEVLRHFKERLIPLEEQQAIAEAKK